MNYNFNFFAADINFTAAIYLFIIYVFSINQLKNKTSSIKFLKLTAALYILQLVLEGTSTFIRYLSDYKIINIQIIVTTLSFVVPSFLTLSYDVFIYKYITHEKKLPLLLTILFGLPVIIDISFAMYNFEYPLYFSINHMLSYQKEKYAYVAFYCSAIHFLIAGIFIFMNRKSLNFREFLIILSVVILPVIGFCLQYFLTGSLFIFSLSSLGMMMVFILLQNKLTDVDLTTNAMTRTAFDFKIDELIKKGEKDFSFAIIDLCDYKLINTNFGKEESEKALKSLVSIINTNIPDGCFVSRLLGDDFIIYFNFKDKKRIQDILDGIIVDLDKYNKEANNKYYLNITYSFDIFDENIYISSNQLIKELDNRIYKRKTKIKVMSPITN